MSEKIKCPFCGKNSDKESVACDCGYFFDLNEYSQSLKDIGPVISSHSASLGGTFLFCILCVSITIFGVIVIISLDFEKATRFATISTWITISFLINLWVIVKRYQTKIDICEKGLYFKTGLKSYWIRFDKIVEKKAISSNNLPPDITIVYDEPNFNKKVVVPTKYFSDHKHICRVLGYG